eukprot:CAMPEP_0173359032 /NCGR_PEP_ID=MMETSP1144-20121109/19800_1 /TAXON_ID=483371 /ORGANISM="non described non described, Strain CCMP2298" /LENGTH=43 /DNA_ID= /DNA_START= /DNA_END= /DNA_ORIENTATION=
MADGRPAFPHLEALGALGGGQGGYRGELQQEQHEDQHLWQGCA